MSDDYDDRLLKATSILAGIALVGHPDYLFDENDNIPEERIEQIGKLSSSACAFLVAHQDLALRVLGEEEFAKIARALDFTGLEDEMTFGSARFADKEDA